MLSKYYVSAGKMFVSFWSCFWSVKSSSLSQVFKAVAKKILIFFSGEISSGFKKVNLVLMTKAAAENHKNIRTKTVAPTFENDLGSKKVSGEKVWKNYGFFNVRKADYSMEKVNFTESSLFYLNQAYRKVKNRKKICYCNYHLIGEIVELSNPSQVVSSYTLKENEVKMI